MFCPQKKACWGCKSSAVASKGTSVKSSALTDGTVAVQLESCHFRSYWCPTVQAFPGSWRRGLFEVESPIFHSSFCSVYLSKLLLIILNEWPLPILHGDDCVGEMPCGQMVPTVSLQSLPEKISLKEYVNLRWGLVNLFTSVSIHLGDKLLKGREDTGIEWKGGLAFDLTQTYALTLKRWSVMDKWLSS